MWFWILSLIISAWVFSDARNRKMDRPAVWAVAVFLLMIVFLPFYFATRSLKKGEVREGGTAWNVVKTFAMIWTITMLIVGISAMIGVGQNVSGTISTAGQAGTAIGTVIGVGMLFGLWFVVLVGALAVGLFVKKSSVIEKGPTGALALEG